ncbi:MAG: LacI family transcriptional regulator [Dorea sp.]|nr:LacI family transcriptional regulator [Dorea sp.]
MKKSNKINIRDIASACDISPATVSRYFNNPGLLSDSTRRKIEQKLKELNFQPGWSMQIQEDHTTNLIIVILPHLQFGFYTELLNQLIEIGKEKGYHMIPYTSEKSKKEELSAIHALCQYRPRGIILLSPLLEGEDIAALPVPVITIERSGGNFMQINSDNFTGGKLAAELLLKNKCEVFVHINNGYSTIWPSFKRIVGFECLMEGQAYERIIRPELSEPFLPIATQTMDEIVRDLLTKYKGKRWGVFCSNDDIARLFEQQCVLKHLLIPDEVEIIGYDNSPISECAIYPITSVAQNIQLMAQLAMDGFDNYIPCETIVPNTLIEKYTTK